MLRWGRWRRKWLDSGPNSWPENQIFSQRAQPGKDAVVVVHKTSFETLLKLITLLWAWLIINNLTFGVNYLLFCNVSELRNNGLSVRTALIFAHSPSRVFGKFSHYFYCAQKYWFVNINDNSLSVFLNWRKKTKNSNGSTNTPFTFDLLSRGLSHTFAGLPVPLNEI